MTGRGVSPLDPFGLVRTAWRVNEVAPGHAGAIARDQGEHWQGVFTQTATVMRAARMSGRHATAADWAGHWRAYLRDSAERAVPAADILRQRADALAAAEAEGAPPALPHAQEPVMEAGGLARPCNARLVRLVPAAAPAPVARPVLLVAPRMGGADGLTGAAAAALAAGLPVHAAGFGRCPVPGQTVADAIDALAAFAVEIARRHPDVPAPAVLGQGPGGWLPLVLSAAHPGATGAVLLDMVALAPGLYLMGVEAVEGRGDARRVEPSLAPALRAAIAPPMAEASRALHPLRLGNAAISSRNPWLGPVSTAAARRRETRQPAAPDNPFVWVERMGFELAGNWLDPGAAMRRAAVDTGFHAVWGAP
ncbi:DUF3141 domain-containing protein [Rhodovulum sp.]|uniref:DUF3141 domain-containing protein n=1 Tax=Rhodovulum sp. TaxID=34009 RepID=UPI0017D4C1F6|nr:DUF3141 domain-containing protein [Rhodovulum sp.]HDR29832.1 DUF3141 domain-containing protein [Rhodovulum sp.]